MPRVSGQKKKLLLIREYLLENTDEFHSVTIKGIREHLSRNGIPAGYQSVKDDVELGLKITTKAKDERKPLVFFLKCRFQKALSHKREGNHKYIVYAPIFSLTFLSRSPQCTQLATSSISRTPNLSISGYVVRNHSLIRG